MSEAAITERQQYWLDYIEAADCRCGQCQSTLQPVSKKVSKQLDIQLRLN